MIMNSFCNPCPPMPSNSQEKPQELLRIGPERQCWDPMPLFPVRVGYALFPISFPEEHPKLGVACDYLLSKFLQVPWLTGQVKGRKTLPENERKVSGRNFTVSPNTWSEADLHASCSSSSILYFEEKSQVFPETCRSSFLPLGDFVFQMVPVGPADLKCTRSCIKPPTSPLQNLIVVMVAQLCK